MVAGWMNIDYLSGEIGYSSVEQRRTGPSSELDFNAPRLDAGEVIV